MRTFFALLPSEAQIEACRMIQDSVRQPQDGLNWVAPENLHVTMLFIGESSYDELEKFTPQLQSITEKFSPIKWQLHRNGFFPKRGAPNVLFTGIRYHGFTMPLLAKKLREAWQEFSKNELKDSFHPHITLARCRNGIKARQLQIFQNALPEPIENVSRELICFESRREDKILRYIPLKRFIFNGT